MAVQIDLFLAEEALPFNIFEVKHYYKADKNALTWIGKIECNDVMPTYVLRRLAARPHAELKMAVADHLNTPHEVLLLLAKDDNPDVRYAIAENHNISRDVLNELCDDVNPYVANRAEKTLSRLDIDDLYSGNQKRTINSL